MINRETIKRKILEIAAVTDRGQRLNKLIAPVYQEKISEINLLLKELKDYSDEVSPKTLSGEWELIFSNVELFRSSPFFLAIEKALNNEFKSNLFFKLHQLQVGSFGLSTIGRIGQIIDFKKDIFISTFDTTIFGMTVIPIIGWFKILPTFGGRVVTHANNINLDKTMLSMKVQKTKVINVNGLNRIPILSNLLMNRWYPIKEIWEKLPWNKEEPSCEISISYIDSDFRVANDKYGSIFIYIKPTKSFLLENDQI